MRGRKGKFFLFLSLICFEGAKTVMEEFAMELFWATHALLLACQIKAVYLYDHMSAPSHLIFTIDDLLRVIGSEPSDQKRRDDFTQVASNGGLAILHSQLVEQIWSAPLPDGFTTTWEFRVCNCGEGKQHGDIFYRKHMWYHNNMHNHGCHFASVTNALGRLVWLVDTYDEIISPNDGLCLLQQMVVAGVPAK
ncbi:MAG: hypothetical protein UR53_C0001G0068 [Candidatus Magasanikbacteria bacterium GW2011_GWC2_34_16]|uniref:Uncharacterized protein n=2 Tax=Candidatus Magasanikiibacteriota TaxID=1752731 RepID=A0A0G0HG17_9BACT|nr:MAG: hypothetical protein UR53_C0001G0068 [Candidatus Magasanikbacteria bacterium GW2011_GWC2_34_16]KKQ41122.1 MAG: hypothetical protein US58_C0005G0047 [Candidatus Magasanikbacteria bacterium GW2011_GWA2_37_8]